MTRLVSAKSEKAGASTQYLSSHGRSHVHWNSFLGFLGSLSGSVVFLAQQSCLLNNCNIHVAGLFGLF